MVEPIITFGKHRNLPYSKLPVDYLKWLVTIDREDSYLAQDELDYRAGTKTRPIYEPAPSNPPTVATNSANYFIVIYNTVIDLLSTEPLNSYVSSVGAATFIHAVIDTSTELPVDVDFELTSECGLTINCRLEGHYLYVLDCNN
jgi:hypothetical protein